MDLDANYITRQIVWSVDTFGPDFRYKGICDHIRKELKEIEAEPRDIYEWIDVIILALDGAWRSGHSPDEILYALHDKQSINFEREWPDWRDASTDHPIEHIR